MQRWDMKNMFIIGRKLFDKIHKRKMHSHHNHEIHFMARDKQWLPDGIQSLVDGSYEPRCLKRYYFSDEMVDQLHISDRIFQHILLRVLKLIKMLENIIKNPIDTPYGYKNPDYGIALRGPLSQFFSGIYLKPLDDAFNQADVTYLRFQDDVLILCKTKRQLNRCKQRMMNVLQERQLTLSKRKTRIGKIESGFHFLGIEYPPTQTADITNIAPVNDDAIVNALPDYCLNNNGEGGENYYQSINHRIFCVLFRTPEQSAAHASKLNGWSPMVFLAQRSNVILFDGYVGG